MLLKELLFADDAAIETHNEIELQRLVERLAEAYDLFGLTISVKKTEVVGQVTDSPPDIKLGGESLKRVDKFVYLGSTITSTLFLDEALTSKLEKAAAALKKKKEHGKTISSEEKPSLLSSKHASCQHSFTGVRHGPCMLVSGVG